VKIADHANIVNYMNTLMTSVAFQYMMDNWHYENLIFDTIIIRDKEKRFNIKTIVI
jgi:hypothetical protein